jgi:RNA polymerase sigma-70 factor, ECF subfamily
VTAMTNDCLAEAFEANRPHLREVAYRMLGSLSEAEDAVQNVWLDLTRADTDAIENLGKWLTTVVARVCLDMLRSRSSRREKPYGVSPPDSLVRRADGIDPAKEALIADSVGLALLVVLDALTPAERVAFVLHDIFELPFGEIARIVDRSPPAARQLASRARRRVRGASVPDTDLPRQRQVVDAFLAASRGGDFEALIAVLDPNVVFRADATAERAGAPGETRGAATVAQAFAGRAHGAQLAMIDGAPGLVWAPGGQPRGLFRFTMRQEKIVAIDLIGDSELVRRMDVVLLKS